ncbi:hypothetical protein ACGFJ5_23630 [Micromonospora echinaurantiaca]|uniref:hypothetical protein n=1 Tax=Micromonospora echinaurantiaca TaxID=47857 RepID=UPI00372381B5
MIPMILRIDGRELRLFSTITTFGGITIDEVAIESYYTLDTISPAAAAAGDRAFADVADLVIRLQ